MVPTSLLLSCLLFGAAVAYVPGARQTSNAGLSNGKEGPRNEKSFVDKVEDDLSFGGRNNDVSKWNSGWHNDDERDEPQRPNKEDEELNNKPDQEELDIPEKERNAKNEPNNLSKLFTFPFLGSNSHKEERKNEKKDKTVIHATQKPLNSQGGTRLTARRLQGSPTFRKPLVSHTGTEVKHLPFHESHTSTNTHVSYIVTHNPQGGNHVVKGTSISSSSHGKKISINEVHHQVNDLLEDSSEIRSDTGLEVQSTKGSRENNSDGDSSEEKKPKSVESSEEDESTAEKHHNKHHHGKHKHHHKHHHGKHNHGKHHHRKHHGK